MTTITITIKAILAAPVILILLGALPTMSTQIVLAHHHDSGGSSDNSGSSDSGSTDNSGGGGSSSSSQSTCPDGSTPDSNGNCPSNQPQSQPQQQQICSDGSQPDSNGNCTNQQSSSGSSNSGIDCSQSADPRCHEVTSTSPTFTEMPDGSVINHHNGALCLVGNFLGQWVPVVAVATSVAQIIPGVCQALP